MLTLKVKSEPDFELGHTLTALLDWIVKICGAGSRASCD